MAVAWSALGWWSALWPAGHLHFLWGWREVCCRANGHGSICPFTPKQRKFLSASCCLTCVKCAEWCMATPHGSGLSDSELVNECSLTLCPGSSGRFEHFKTNHIPIQLIRILHYALGKLSRCLVRFQHQSYLLSFTTLMLWYKTQTLIRCFLGWLLANKAAVQSNKSELQFGWNLRILIGCYRALISRYPSQCDAPVQSPTLLALEQIWSLLAKMRPKPAGHISFVHHLSTVYVMAGGGL